MADVKKSDKAPAKPTVKNDPFIEIVSWIVGLFVVLYLLNGFVSMFTSNGFFSRGWQSFTPQGIMLNHTSSIGSLSNPTGARVVSMNSSGAAVYDSPGGKQIGTQPFNSRGKILQGYVEVNGQKYWYVDFDKGNDGWVKEEDIAALNSEPTFFEKIILWAWSVLPALKFFSVFLSLIFILWIAYLVFRLTKIRQNQRSLIYPTLSAETSNSNPKWEKILIESDSLNENDWKLAIIEADIMLSEILDKLQLPGETMGDKMKAVEKSDFTTIDNAWEAHKIRNQIAHEGSDFILTSHEVKRVIGLYQTVFEEFQVI